MAPVANNSNNNIRQTGTVPKTSSKNSVPQEVVAPTRRDLQQHFNVSIKSLNDKRTTKFIEIKFSCFSRCFSMCNKNDCKLESTNFNYKIKKIIFRSSKITSLQISIIRERRRIYKYISIWLFNKNFFISKYFRI